MKKYALALILCPMWSLAQVKYTIKGEIGTLNTPSKAYLVFKTNSEDKITEAAIVNGKFQFVGEMVEPDMALIAIDPEGKKNLQDPNTDSKVIFLENGEINIKGNSIRGAKLTGGTLNKDMEVFMDKVRPAQERLGAFSQEFQKVKAEVQNDPTKMAEYQERYNAILSELKGLEYEFVTQHSASFFSLRIIEGWLQTPNYNAEGIIQVMDGFLPVIKASNKWKSMMKQLKNQGGTDIGAIALDIEQNDVDGKPIKLSSLRGKYILLDFWASWCGPCRGENPNVVAAFQKYKDKGFTVFGVSLDNNKTNWLQAIITDQLTWTHVSDLQGWGNAAAQQYKVQGIPQNFLIDPNGKIIAKNLRGEELHQKLKAIFGE